MVPQTTAGARIEAILGGFAARSLQEIVLGLERINLALERLGNPHHRLPPVVHVAGTNGKGSTCAYMRAILEAGGRRVHVFTSPHLVRFNERIVLAGTEISDEVLADVLGRCEQAAGDLPLSYFEAVTAAAFLTFAEVPADVVILETGLGGRLDATNVIDRPRAAVITPIGLDHMSWLGETLEAIAGEKAGILKPDTAFVTGAQRSEAMGVLKSRAFAIGARPHVFGEDWAARLENGRLLYEDGDGLMDVSPPRMLGSHQIDNAATAIAALKAGGLIPSASDVSTGLEAAFWPARMQRLTRGPLVALAERFRGERAELWLDGGHNPHAAKALARTLADLDERSPRPVILIVGMQERKDAHGFFEPFTDLVASVYTVTIPAGQPHDAATLAQAARDAGLPAEPAENVETALRGAMDATGRSGEGMPRILICGSLYLAGHILRDHA